MARVGRKELREVCGALVDVGGNGAQEPQGGLAPVGQPDTRSGGVGGEGRLQGAEQARATGDSQNHAAKFAEKLVAPRDGD